MSQEIRIPVSWGSLAAIATGPLDGPRVLFLHGWLDNAASFTPLIAALPEDWRCIALDLPGHGHSDHRPAGAQYHLLDAVADVLHAADALGWDRFTLVGHSLGGGVATLLAGSFPERIDHLVLLEGLGPMTSGDDEMPARFREQFEKTVVLASKTPPIYASLELCVRARLQAGAISKEGTRLLVERGTRPFKTGFTWRSDPRLRLPSQRLNEAQVLAFLRRITAPTLCLIADQGIIYSFSGWRERLAAVAELTSKQVAGEHHFHLDRPSEVAAVVRDALPPLPKPGHAGR